MLTILITSWLLTAVLIYIWFYIVEIILDLPVSGQTPCTAHASLKTIIRRVLRDASNMTILKHPQDETDLPGETTNETYEDLLATTILNKVIDNYQHEVRRSSSASTSSKKSDKLSKHKKGKQTSHSVDHQPKGRSQENFDTASVSSVEDWCRSESSVGSKHVDPMSLTIQHSIEEISSSEDDSSQNNFPSSSLSRSSFRNSDIESSLDREGWQDNWLFSRRGRGSPKPVPVPMLVPSPSTEFRALIGDRDADDTTDLSETGSDIDDTETIPDIKNILVDSRTIIGGKNLLGNINPELLDPDIYDDSADGGDELNLEYKRGKNGITEVHVHAEVIREDECDETENKEKGEEKQSCPNIIPEVALNLVSPMNGEVIKELHSHDVHHNEIENKKEENEDMSEAKNDIVILETPYEESDSLSSNTEKDAEYTEKYASFPRPIQKKSPVPSPRSSNKNNHEQTEYLEQNETDDFTTENESLRLEVDDMDDPELSHNLQGSYSQREKQKWRNPIALKNNPYSKENIDKRLQNKSNYDNNEMFGRDYYIRDAKKATGGKEKTGDTSLKESSSDLDPKSLPLTNFNDYNKKNVDASVFTAVPAVIDEDVGDVVDQVKKEQKTRPQSLALSSDSDDIEIKRVYNVETGTLHKYKEDLAKNERKIPKIPGIKQFIVDEMISPSDNYTNRNNVNEKFDENHNHTCDNVSRIKSQEPVMKISAFNHLQSVGVKNYDTPKEEQRKPEQCMSDEVDSFKTLHDQVDKPLNDTEYSVQMRDSSRKYLNSLVKNSKKSPTEIMNQIILTPSISLEENGPKTPEFKFNDFEPYNKCISCIDLRSDKDEPKNEFLSLEYPSLKEMKIVSNLKQDYTKSVPNITECDDSEFRHFEDNVVKPSVKTVIDLEELARKPSVRDLRKLFDQDEPKVTSRITNQLTSPKNNTRQKQVHSLTARSIPTDVRRKLQQTPTENIISERNGSPQDENDLDVLSQIPKCRTKIQFFECLKPNLKKGEKLATY